MRSFIRCSVLLMLILAALLTCHEAKAQFTQQGAKLVGTGAVGNANQGWGVALSGDGNTAIVGGSSDNSGAGAAWVFTRSGGVWTQQGTKLVGTGATGDAAQGWAVALSADGNTAIVGGTHDVPTGAAWVFAALLQAAQIPTLESTLVLTLCGLLAVHGLLAIRRRSNHKKAHA